MNDELRVGTDELRLETESASSRADLVSTVPAGLPPGVAVLDDEYRIVSWNVSPLRCGRAGDSGLLVVMDPRQD